MHADRYADALAVVQPQVGDANLLELLPLWTRHIEVKGIMRSVAAERRGLIRILAVGDK